MHYCITAEPSSGNRESRRAQRQRRTANGEERSGNGAPRTAQRQRRTADGAECSGNGAPQTAKSATATAHRWRRRAQRPRRTADGEEQGRRRTANGGERSGKLLVTPHSHNFTFLMLYFPLAFPCHRSLRKEWSIDFSEWTCVLVFPKKEETRERSFQVSDYVLSDWQILPFHRKKRWMLFDDKTHYRELRKAYRREIVRFFLFL